MQIISRKLPLLETLFRQMDINDMKRIDAYEVFAVCTICVEGNFEQFVDQIFTNFSFREEYKIFREEVIYFIDGLFRGLAKVFVKKEDIGNEVPGKSWRLMPRDIDDFVLALFIGRMALTREEFFVNFTQLSLPMIEYLRAVRATVAEEA